MVLIKDFSFLRNNLDFNINNIFYKFIYIWFFTNNLLDFIHKYIKYITKKRDKNVKNLY